MTDVEAFQFPATGQNVRMVLRNDQPWFVGRDACAALAISKPENSLALLDEDEKDTHTVGTPGGPQVVTLISESGLYSLILRSRKAEAKAFKRWITHEVLPSIRRTGQYRTPLPHAPQAGFGINVFQPDFYTYDEVCALLRQMFGISLTVNELTRNLRSGGVLKQNGAPTKKYVHWFWFTNSAWNIQSHCVPQVAFKVYDTGREMQDWRFLQARLELDGIGRPPLAWDRPAYRSLNP
jgi:hypothetical protein